MVFLFEFSSASSLFSFLINERILASVVLSFARCLGEFGATLMVAGNIPGKTQTMSVAVYTAMQGGDRELAYKWVAIIVAYSLIILVGLNCLPSLRRSRR